MTSQTAHDLTPSAGFFAALFALGAFLALLLAVFGAPIWAFYVAPLLGVPPLLRELRSGG